MKDVFNVYSEGFEEVARMVAQGNYKGAFVVPHTSLCSLHCWTMTTGSW